MRSEIKANEKEPKLGDLQSFLVFAWRPIKIDFENGTYQWIWWERYVEVRRYERVLGYGAHIYLINKWVVYRRAYADQY